jgi:hypothetical protein
MRSSKGDLHLLTVGAYLGCNPSLRQVDANLEAALCRLREVRNLKEIRIVDSSEARKTPPGYAVLERSTGQALVGPEDEIRPVQLVADASAMSLTQLESFVVRFGNWNLPFFALSKDPENRRNVLSAFSCVTKLHLDLDIGDEDLHPGYPTLQQVNDFCGLLNSTLGCEDLSIQIRT